MVIVNPKLSLPSDLPYKKRQRPFFSNTPLQQATIRYNEAIRKKYNDIQFAKRLENGSATQNEVLGINTIDISRMVDPTLFAEMSSMNPLTIVKKRRSKRFDSPSGPSTCSSGDIFGTNCSGRIPTSSIDSMRSSNTNNSVQTGEESFPIQNGNTSTSNFICNNNEMFPQLQATINMERGKSNNNTAFFAAAATPTNIKPPSTSSLEAQAISEYEPTIDSAHDMIFGNVMGMDYGNYVHGPLWTTQQSCGNGGCNTSEQHQHLQAPSLGCSNKLSVGGYGSSPQPMHSVAPPPPLYDVNNSMVNESGNTMTSVTGPLPVMGKPAHCGGPGGTGRRSTSVPRPRTGTQKETLKQAAIRCGIIKGSHAVSTIPKRSHCLAPLQLTPVQSDPVVSVVEILHPKSTMPACSSEALVGFEDLKLQVNNNGGSNSGDLYVIHNNKSTPALNIAMNVHRECTKPSHNSRMEKSNSDGHGQVPAEIDNSTIRTLDNAISCPTL